MHGLSINNHSLAYQNSDQNVFFFHCFQLCFFKYINIAYIVLSNENIKHSFFGCICV